MSSASCIRQRRMDTIPYSLIHDPAVTEPGKLATPPQEGKKAVEDEDDDDGDDDEDEAGPLAVLQRTDLRVVASLRVAVLGERDHYHT
ncbi:hypothetical protein NUW54_g8513 [Trametes sanguinea]|uniref:Uncharacterized protein n=1 Tax=Trametes sanguinea TaxID=158606 RepID=A0ACC1PF71_9APHY|nr:hypothetical protein NUW54_g8513 [Trametes sanguinea]